MKNSLILKRGFQKKRAFIYAELHYARQFQNSLGENVGIFFFIFSQIKLEFALWNSRYRENWISLQLYLLFEIFCWEFNSFDFFYFHVNSENPGNFLFRVSRRKFRSWIILFILFFVFQVDSIKLEIARQRAARPSRQGATRLSIIRDDIESRRREAEQTFSRSSSVDSLVATRCERCGVLIIMDTALDIDLEGRTLGGEGICSKKLRWILAKINKESSYYLIIQWMNYSL